jgi:hypothetical protein
MDLVFNDLTDTERRIHELRAEIGYIALCEIVDRNNDRVLARVDFNTGHLAGYLRDDRPPLSRAGRGVEPAGDEEGEEIEDHDEDDEHGEDDPRLADLGLPDSSLPSLEQLAHAAMRWVRYTVAANMGGEQARDFKIRVHSAKGHRTLHACRFSVNDLDRGGEPARGTVVPFPPPAPTVMPVAPAPGTENLPESRTWRALGEGYTNFVGLLQATYAHLAHLQNTALSNQDQRIQHLQHGLNSVTGELVKLRVGLAEAGNLERQEGNDSRVREELGKTFIAELGTLGRALATSKFGMPPELAELAEIIAASPELTEAIRNPDVRKLLRNEKTRRELAGMLNEAAGGTAQTPPSTGTPPAA